MVWGSALGALFFMAQFLQSGLGFSPLVAGLGLMPWGATTVVVPRIVGALINRVGERAFIVGGLSLNATAMGWIALVADPDLAYWQLVAPQIISGAGVAMAIPASQSSVLTSVAPQFIGKASGTFATMRQLGGAFGVAVTVAVFAGAGSYVSPQAFVDGFAAAVVACAALSLAGALAGATLPRRRAVADGVEMPIARPRGAEAE
jgi:MFS family permease